MNSNPHIVRLFLDRGMNPNATHSELIMRPKRSTSSNPPSRRPSDGEPDLSPSSAIMEASLYCWKLAQAPIAAGLEESPLGREIISAQELDTSLLELYIAYGAMLEPSLLLYAVVRAYRRARL